MILIINGLESKCIVVIDKSFYERCNIIEDSAEQTELYFLDILFGQDNYKV